MEIVIVVTIVIALALLLNRIIPSDEQTEQGSFFIDPRDGKKYRTVKIGDQVWMAQNLNYYTQGSKYYGNDESNSQRYGRLYNWEAAMKACPEGWHLPSDAEWRELINFAGGEEIAGTKLKASFGWSDAFTGCSANGSDIYGFSALPGGYGCLDGSFIRFGYSGDWWSAGTWLGPSIWYIFGNKTIDFSRNPLKDNLYSVRCVQDVVPHSE